jgi:tRNA(Ile)-lysidine synthase
LRATLKARGIGWIEDPSNEAQDFERPRLRAARAHLDALGLTSDRLALSAARLSRARRALETIAHQFCRQSGAVSVHPCGYVTIDRTRLQEAEEEIGLRVLSHAVTAAGGGGQPVPLGKLEAIAAALRAAGTEEGTWTLARAMIGASGKTITVEREPGREPLPELKLRPGESAQWDGRFLVEVGANASGGAFDVRPLGEAAARELRRKGDVARIPTRAASLAPSFWRDGALLAVPCLEFWSSQHLRDVLRAHFAWNGSKNEPQCHGSTGT